MLIPDDNIKGSTLTPEAHVTKALTLDRRFQTPPNLPLDLQDALLESAERIQHSRFRRMKQAQRLEDLAEPFDTLDRAILSRMSASIKVAAANDCLGLLTVLTLTLRWPE